jgi:radical SAM protein with 4Fe4S-binding SPASM domain
MSKIEGRWSNAVLAGYSFALSSVMKKHYLAGMPVALTAELTSHCNLNCPECPTGSGVIKRKRGFMELSLFGKLIDELGPSLYYLNLYFQGEPMLHPGFFNFLEKSGKINTIVSTNGHFLSEENAGRLVSSGIKKIIVSLDGMDSQTYLRYRVNGDFESVMRGISNISEAKKQQRSGVSIVLQFLVNKYNENQIYEARRFARRMGCSLSLKSMQVIDMQKAGDWMPSGDKFRRYINKSSGTDIKSSLPDRCARAWLNPVVTWDGKVLPCCFDKDARNIMGDLNEESFSEIWNGPRFRIFRKSILSGRNMIEICRNCTSGLKGVKS